MKARVIKTRIWSEDEKFAELSANAKLLFVYYFTNERIGITGIYECPDRKTMFETSLTLKQLEQAKQELSEKEMVMFCRGWVYVRNAERHNKFKGEKNDKAREKELLLIPKEVKSLFDRGINGVSRGKDTLQYSVISNQYPVKGGNRGEKPEASVSILADEKVITELQGNYPRLNVRSEVAKMVDWLKANGKTKKDYLAFARNWLRKCEEQRPKTDSSQVYCPKCGKQVLRSHLTTHPCKPPVSSFAKSLAAQMGI